MPNASSSVDLQTLHKTDDQGPCNVTQSPSFSFKENVKTLRNFCNRNGSNKFSMYNNKSFLVSKKCFVCGSKFHLIRDCDFYENQLRLNNAPVWKNVENIPSFVPRPAYVPTGSRNRPTSVPAGRSFPAGRPFPTGWHNLAARPMTRPKSNYFQQFSRPGSYNQMDMDGGRWETAVKTSAGCSWQSNRPKSMTGNKEKLADFVKIKGGTTTFGGGDGKITDKGTIRTSTFNFENVYYVEELQNFNLLCRGNLLCFKRQSNKSNPCSNYNLRKIADTVPAVSAIPATSIPAGSINPAAGGSAVPSIPSSSMVEPVHADDTPLPPGHSSGSSENSTRFPSPSDLANHISSSIRDAPHKKVHPISPDFLGIFLHQFSPGIFERNLSQDKNVQDMLKKLDMENVEICKQHPLKLQHAKSKEDPEELLIFNLYRIPNDSDSELCWFLMEIRKSKSTNWWMSISRRRLISWQCKKQTIVATSSTEAEYVAAANLLTLNPVQAIIDQMAALKYRDEHNKVGFLEKSKGSTDYDQVIDFLLDSHIRYAIVSDPLIYDSLIKQFWSTASLLSSESGPPAIVATIDGTPYTITESLVRSSLLLNDEGGIVDMSIAEIYTGMHNLGYPTEGKLTIHKNKFSPQWRFLIHTLLHCLSTKSGSWDQFGSPLAIALICLCEGRKFNWSSYIFNGMVNNIQNSNKFLMYPRFLQMILNIETRNTKPYRAFRLTSKMFANMRLNFHGDHMPLLASMLAPAQPAIAGESSGEAEPSVPPNVPEKVTETVHSHAQVSTTPRPAPTNTDARVHKQGSFFDPNFELTSTQAHDSIPDPVPSTNVEDDAFRGSFDISPPRSTKAPPAGTTSGGAADPEKLTALCSLVNSLVQKIDSQASDLTAHKLVFKEVVGKLIKKVKELEDKLKARKKKFVVTESDIEEEEEQDVDPLIKLAKAAATAADDSAVPSGDSKKDDVPPSSTIPSDAFAGGSFIPPGDTTGSTAAPSDKGKSPLLEEEHPVRKRSFRQREEDRLGEEAAKKLYEEEMAALERETEEMKKKRQQDMMDLAKYYTDDDWINIMGQVHANQGLSANLLGPDVTEDNFAERMVALIAKRRREFAAQRFKDKLNKPLTYAQQKEYMRTFVKNQSSTIYSTGWTMKHVKSLSDDQLKEEFDKIRAAVGELQSQNIWRSLKRPGADMAQDSSKKSKPTDVPPAILQMSSAVVPPTATPPPSGFSPPPNVPSVEPTTHSYGTRRRSLRVRKKQLGW
ncbi:hypothetical protein Tco_1283689, partial [Tanacetum coccineum]